MLLPKLSTPPSKLTPAERQALDQNGGIYLAFYGARWAKELGLDTNPRKERPKLSDASINAIATA